MSEAHITCTCDRMHLWLSTLTGPLGHHIVLPSALWISEVDNMARQNVRFHSLHTFSTTDITGLVVDALHSKAVKIPVKGYWKF